jgi:nicotinate-nucleotide adenylyltransferase
LGVHHESEDDVRLTAAELAEIVPPELGVQGEAGDIEERLKVVMVAGGSFDPPHKGHVFLPMLARQSLEKSSGVGSVHLLYVPAFVSPHKVERKTTSAVHRAAMIRLATGHVPRTSVWMEEIARGERTGEASFTVETLRRLRGWLDQAGRGDVSLRLVIGMDQLLKLHTWREPQQIVRLARPVILQRELEGQGIDVARELAGSGVWDEQDIAWLMKGIIAGGKMPYSSTAIRRAIANGQTPEGLDPLVAGYIQEQGLYC